MPTLVSRRLRRHEPKMGHPVCAQIDLGRDPVLVGEDDGGLDLAVGDGPVAAKQ